MCPSIRPPLQTVPAHMHVSVRPQAFVAAYTAAGGEALRCGRLDRRRAMVYTLLHEQDLLVHAFREAPQLWEAEGLEELENFLWQALE
jgi:hypothetical protein